ncbi:hypothetical protein JTE90_000974 [Oedothorax gibbosus]|uniref:Uncharacterized protein n=1 Tax=Oedothorax gibbosus TaxID=931172 RepID=A0AAV6VCQ5_9ARAC|nr:hypothetical protein JTE90_000974 [Oedothorax gibbosus]
MQQPGENRIGAFGEVAAGLFISTVPPAMSYAPLLEYPRALSPEQITYSPHGSSAGKLSQSGLGTRDAEHIALFPPR